ncbi:MAG: hypothetical protein QW251_03145 [Desulfurococcaceae archaeon]
MNRKKILIRLEDQPVLFRNEDEGIDLILGAVKPFFRRACGVRGVPLLEETLYIANGPRDLLDLNVLGQIKLRGNPLVVNPHAFLLSWSEEEAYAIVDAYCIYYGDKLLGYYMPELRSLWLTWVSYSVETARFFTEEIWPKLLPKLKKLGLKKISPKPKGEVKITLGTDPEFEILDKAGDYIPASKFFRGLYRAIGTDGYEATGELRPSPSESPEGLVGEIASLLKELAEKIQGQGVFSFAGRQLALGGHIHFGLPEDGVFYIPELVKALDIYLGRHLLRCNSEARRGSGYWHLSGYEEKPWGFEYRTPPAVYLAHPEWARIVFKLAKRVVERLLSKGEIEVEVDEEGKATSNALQEFLAPEEINVFLRFAETWEDISRPERVYEAWGLPKPHLYTVIRFRDKWSEDRKNLLEEVLNQVLDQDKAPALIILYGLHRDRGFVSTIPGGVTEIKEGSYPEPLWLNGGLWIGLPYEFRMGLPSLSDCEVLYRDLFNFFSLSGFLAVDTESAVRIAMQREKEFRGE